MAIGVLLVGGVSLVLGSVFIVQATGTSAEIKAGLVDENGSINGNVVDTTTELEAEQAVLLQHMHDSYGKYGETERNSPERTLYLDGLTLMNSVYIATMGYGVTTVILVIGLFMIIVGLALGATGFVLLRPATISQPD